MIEKLIAKAVENRLLVLILVLALIGGGIFSWNNLATDAFPDASPVLVPIFAEVEGMAPQEVERQVTFPIEQAMNGLPDVELVKSTSAFGMAVIYVYFEDDVDIYFARQLVAQRLATVRSSLKALEQEPALGPIATGLGEVFMYYLDLDSTADTEGKPDLAYLREVNDWVVKPQIGSVKGVTDVLSMGGNILQYQINVNPLALRQHELTFEDVKSAVLRNNRNVGGQYLEIGGEEHLIRGIGLIESLDDLKNIAVKVVDGVPIPLSEVGQVEYGPAMRRGVVTLNGEREIVAGMVMKLYGENTSEVISRLNKKFKTIGKALPQGVKIVPYYNQQALVNRATGTMGAALLQGALLILVVLLLFLGDIRSALIVAVSVPICALTAVLLMGWQGLSANLMSLGGIAIAIGLLADGAIVMVENIHRHLTSGDMEGLSKKQMIIRAAREVARPVLFSLMIVMIVFVPVFSLEGVEGKMFKPMAMTMIFAIFGSIIVSLFVAPVLSYFGLVAHESKGTHFLMVLLEKLYRPLLKVCVRFKKSVALLAVALFVLALTLVPKLGTEFIPVLDEGNITFTVAMAPSISLKEAEKAVRDLEKMVLKFPEVTGTVAKIGRPEAGGHPHPINSGLVQLDLAPQKEWRYETKEELIAAIDSQLSTYPGVQLSYTQPIQHLFDDLITGSKSQLVIKLYGENIDTLRATAERIKTAISGVKGLVDLSTEQSYGQPQKVITVNDEVADRYGISTEDIMAYVEEAIGGTVVDNVSLGTRSFPIRVRLDEPFRGRVKDLEALPIPTEDGGWVELGRVATISPVHGPLQINREKGQRRWSVEANIRGRDLGSVVADVQTILDNMTLPDGVFPDIGGQFENQQRAMKRLSYIVPIALFAILILLYLAFRSVKTAMLIGLSIPLSLIGGVLGLWITGEYLSVPASIGFIALFGIAVQDAMVMVSSIHHLRSSGIESEKAIIEGAVLRLRPVLLTTLTTFLGLLPLMLSKGAGAEVQRPLAVVVLFGLLTSTTLTLLVKPALYSWFEKNDEEIPIDGE